MKRNRVEPEAAAAAPIFLFTLRGVSCFKNHSLPIYCQNHVEIIDVEATSNGDVRKVRNFLISIYRYKRINFPKYIFYRAELVFIK